MFKFVLWTAAISTTGAAALFVPIDPALLAAVGLAQGENIARAAPKATSDSQALLKIISASPQSGQKTAITVVRGPLVSAYQAPAKTAPAAAPQRSRSAAFAAPSRLPIARAPIAQAPAADPAGPVSGKIIRSLQHELRRVGCYQGRIDGDWGPASRFAMAAFTRSVNAALPTGRPDIVLLTLVRRHVGVACGRNRAVPVQTAAPLVPSARVKTTRAWRTRVAPARPRLAQRPRPETQRLRLVETPRVVRGQGRQSGTATIVLAPTNRPVSAKTAPGSAYRPFNADSRMALGAVPAPRAARPVTTSPELAIAPRSSPRRASVRPRYKRTRSVKRRRYRRRSRARSWRRKVFPNFYN